MWGDIPSIFSVAYVLFLLLTQLKENSQTCLFSKGFYKDTQEFIRENDINSMITHPIL